MWCDSFMALNLRPRLTATVSNSADKNVVKCNYGRESQLLSRRLLSLLVHDYVTLKYEVWRCFFFSFSAIVSRYWKQSLTEILREEEPRIAVPVTKTTDIFLLLQHVCASVII